MFVLMLLFRIQFTDPTVVHAELLTPQNAHVLSLRSVGNPLTTKPFLLLEDPWGKELGTISDKSTLRNPAICLEVNFCNTLADGQNVGLMLREVCEEKSWYNAGVPYNFEVFHGDHLVARIERNKLTWSNMWSFSAYKYQITLLTDLDISLVSKSVYAEPLRLLPVLELTCATFLLGGRYWYYALWSGNGKTPERKCSL